MAPVVPYREQLERDGGGGAEVGLRERHLHEPFARVELVPAVRELSGHARVRNGGRRVPRATCRVPAVHLRTGHRVVEVVSARQLLTVVDSVHRVLREVARHGDHEVAERV